MFHIESVDHIALTVKDIERSATWYQSVLGMERRHQDIWNTLGDPAMLCAGTACVALFPPDTAAPLPSPDHNTLAMRHFALKVNRANFEQAQLEFRRQGIEFDFEDHNICRSIYVFDPDGHRVELTTYELSS
jgi:catechol 2,3-dioxygenase-like lactoylglutathione lyase family enzyme